MSWLGRILTFFRWNERLRRLMLGLPALLAAVGVGASGVALAWHRGQPLAARYLAEGNSALAEGDLSRAHLCFSRAEQLRGGDPSVVFGLARVAERQGKTQRAARLMNVLAPVDKVGLPQAHLWVAKKLISEAGSDPRIRQLAVTHLRRALTLPESEREEAHAILAEYNLAENRPAAAKEHLLNLRSDRFLSTKFLLAQIYRREGDENSARSVVNSIVAAASNRLRNDPLSEEARVLQAAGYMFLDDYPAAVRTLRTGLESSPGSLRLRRSLSDAFYGWLEWLQRTKPSGNDERFAILDSALQHDASDARLLLFLWRVIDEEDPKADDAMTVVRAMLVLGRNVGLCHFILGTNAWKHDRKEEALVHLEIAHKANPTYPMIANNLAWVLTEGPKPDLPRALKLVESALAVNPNDARFRGTRGHVLAKMERYKEALPDLEASLPAFPNEPLVHERLTLVYSKLGDLNLAEQHRKLAEEKRRRQQESKPKRPG